MKHYDTNQRKTLLDYLLSRSHETLTAKQIAADLEKEGVSMSAVYRNLTQLEESGEVQKVPNQAGVALAYRYSGSECHNTIHLTCKQCKKVFHLKSEESEMLTNMLLENDSFAIDKGATVLYGVCKNCLAV